MTCRLSRKVRSLSAPVAVHRRSCTHDTARHAATPLCICFAARCPATPPKPNSYRVSCPHTRPIPAYPVRPPWPLYAKPSLSRCSRGGVSPSSEPTELPCPARANIRDRPDRRDARGRTIPAATVRGAISTALGFLPSVIRQWEQSGDAAWRRRSGAAAIAVPGLRSRCRRASRRDSRAHQGDADKEEGVWQREEREKTDSESQDGR